MHLEPALVNQLLGFFGVGALQADDDRHVNGAHVLVSVNNALRHAVAADDAAEDVDQDGLHRRVAEDDAEGLLNPLGIGRTANVQEVGRLTTAELDDVHGGHGQAGTIHHAADIAVELHVVEAGFSGFHLRGVLLGGVAHGSIVRVAVEAVAVEGHLGVHRDDAVIGGLEDGVDLEHRGIAADVGGVEGLDEFDHLLERLAGQAEVEGDAAGLEIAQAERRVDGLLEDLVRRLLRDGLDVHATLGAVHDDVAALTAVEQHAHVEFARLAVAGLVDVLGDEDAVDLLALRVGLGGHQVATEDAGGGVLHVLEALGEDHPVAARLGDSALATASRVNLRLDDKPPRAGLLLELHSHLVGLFRSGGDAAFLNGDTVLLEDGLALEFVEVHDGGC